MEIFTAILADAADGRVQESLHRLDHAGAVETIRIERADLARRRLRVLTDRGREIAIALSREERLFDGAVLALSPVGALLVRVEAEAWLRVRPRDGGSALALGYHAGNLHWRVRFEGADLLVALERDEEVYRDRLADLSAAGRITIVGRERTGMGEAGRVSAGAESAGAAP